MITKPKRNPDQELSFSHVYLKNWKNFTNVDVPLPRRCFLVGPNASGKSNFLDVFRFLHDIASEVGGGLQESIQKRNGIKKIRALAARRDSDVMIRVKVGNTKNPELWEYALHMGGEDDKSPAKIKKEYVAKNGQVIIERPNEQDEKDDRLLTQTQLEQVSANREFRELADFFESIQYLHIVPQIVRDPDRLIGKKRDPYGSDFLEQMAKTLSRRRNSWFKQMEKALKIAVPNLEGLRLERDERGTPHLSATYRHWRAHGAQQDEIQFSDGTLRLMGILWAMLNGTGPLLLEEPELSLHQGIIRYLPQLFARVQRIRGRQLLLSTHSQDLLQDDGIGLDEVLLLKFAGNKEGTTLESAKQKREISSLLKGGCNLADVVLSQTRPERAEQMTFLFPEGA